MRFFLTAKSWCGKVLAESLHIARQGGRDDWPEALQFLIGGFRSAGSGPARAGAPLVFGEFDGTKTFVVKGVLKKLERPRAYTANCVVKQIDTLPRLGGERGHCSKEQEAVDD